MTMTKKEAITIMQVYKEELSNRTDFGDIGLRALISMQIEAFELAIKALSESVDETKENGLFIKIYDNDEPSVKAEKLYRICDESEMKSVAEYLKEYFPIEDRTQGKWVLDPNGVDWNIPAWRCSRCGFVAKYIGVEANGLGGNPMDWAGSNYCAHCGADMRGKDNER